MVGFNSHKPGRPAHVNHAYSASPLRVGFRVEVEAGNRSHARHELAGLLELLEELGEGRRAYLVRGDKDDGGGFSSPGGEQSAVFVQAAHVEKRAALGARALGAR